MGLEERLNSNQRILEKYADFITKNPDDRLVSAINRQAVILESFGKVIELHAKIIDRLIDALNKNNIKVDIRGLL